MENDEKLDSEFRFALDLSQQEREQSSTLNTGYDEGTATWRVIVRYYGDLYEVERQMPGVQVIPLYHQYGIVRVSEGQLEALAALPQIQYMEKPKEVYFSLYSFCAGKYKCRPGVSERRFKKGPDRQRGYRWRGGFRH